MKTVKARKKVKIFLESVMKTVFYVKRAPLNSNVGSLTLPLLGRNDTHFSKVLWKKRQGKVMILHSTFQVQIVENRAIKDLSVPNLKQKGISLTNSSDALQGAQILKDPSHPGSARISYRPLRMEKLQTLLKSNHALQFSVKYDVDRHLDTKGGIHKLDNACCRRASINLTEF